MNQYFDKVVGTGGIGIGMLFHTDDDRTLGRSESRLVTLSDAKDYCKLHIVFHYIATILTPGKRVIPVGCVGTDSNGERLIHQMQQCGMDTSFVSRETDYPTAISVCLQYPDKEGCNFTAKNGAGEAVTPEYIRTSLERIGIDEHTIVAAIPEVSLESRTELLRMGKERGSYCVLSFAAAEGGQVREQRLLRDCNLLAVNEEEALSILTEPVPRERLAESMYQYASTLNPDITVMVTCGKHGAFVCDQHGTETVAPLTSQVVNTAGAGDAFLGGTISALALGYPLKKGCHDVRLGETPLKTAPEFGALCAGMAVESPDSIAEQVNANTIAERCREQNLPNEFGFLPTK